jgi:Tfp pilus assembly protein PilV
MVYGVSVEDLSARHTPGAGTHREDGISLLEVLVAVVLILLTVPFMVAIELQALKLNGDAGEIDAATWAAQAKIEEFRAATYADVKGTGEDEHLLPDGRVVTRQWAVSRDQPAKGTKTITVTALERDNFDAKPVEISFVLATRTALP